MTRNVDVAIVGGGPAGLAAALSAHKAGARSILVLERDSFPGGILQQCIHNGFGLHYFGQELTGPEYAQRFIDEVEKIDSIEILLDTMVMEVHPDKTLTAVSSKLGMVRVQAGAIVLAILKLMQRVVHVNTLKRLEVQFIHRTQTLAFLNEYFTNLGVTVLNVDFHAESRPEGNLYTNLYTLTMPAKTSYVDIIGTLSEYPNIRTVRTRNL